MLPATIGTRVFVASVGVDRGVRGEQRLAASSCGLMWM
jgi:hypothetical protein